MSDLEHDALRQAARAYGLDPDRLTPVASAYRPAAALRAGAVLLKPYRYGERQLYYVTRALRHLEGRGFGPAPRLVQSRTGQPYVRAGERWWYAITWIDGRPPRLPAELCLAAASLAAFHRAAEGQFIPFHPSRSWRRRWRGLLVDLHGFQRLAQAGATPFDRAFAEAAPHFIGRAEEALAGLDGSAYDRLEGAVRGRTGFCHRDCTVSNLVVDETGRVCLVDPDTWGPELRLHDVMRLLLSGAGNDAALALAAVAAYEADWALEPGERRLLPDACLLPREFWWAGVCRYRRVEPGVDPLALLHDAISRSGDRAAFVRALRGALLP